MAEVYAKKLIILLYNTIHRVKINPKRGYVRVFENLPLKYKNNTRGKYSAIEV